MSHRLPLVFVHGFPLDRTLFADQEELSDVARLLSFDLPGFGAAANLPPVAGMAGYVDAVTAALDAARIERAVLCGLSMGGYILFELWRRCPERAAALILCDTRAEADPPEGKRARLEGIAKVRAGERAELIAGYLPKLLGPASLQREEVMARVRAMSAAASDQGIVAALQAMHDRPDSTLTLASIRVPTLILVGEEDSLTPPAAARAIQAGIAGSELQEIPGAGHLTTIENPSAVNAALRGFLARV